MSNRTIMAAAGSGASISTQKFITSLESVTMGSFTASSIAINPTTKETYMAFSNNVSKFNADGTLAWQKSLSSTVSFIIKGIAIAPNNNVMIVASNTGSGACYVIRLNSAGTIISNFLFTIGIDIALARGVITLSDSSYIVVYDGGGITLPSYGHITKFSSTHTQLWSSVVYDPGDVNYYSVLGIDLDPSGNIYTLVVKNNSSYFVFKLNSDGTVAWQRSFSGYTSAINGIAASTDSVYVFGNDQTNGRFNLVKLASATGAVTWERSITVSGTRQPGQVRIGNDGAIYCLGSLNTAGLGLDDLVIYKFDAAGNSVWQRVFGTSADDVTGNPRDLVFDGLGSFYISSDVATLSRVYIARLPTDGTLTGTYNPITYGNVIHAVSTTSVVATATSTEPFLNSNGAYSGVTNTTITTPDTTFTATRITL